jgi:hypothetical protein
MKTKSEYDQEYYLKNKEKKKEREKERYSINKEKIKEERKNNYLNNKTVIVERVNKYYLSNIEKISDYKKDYRLKNSEKIKAYRLSHKKNLRIYFNNKYATDILYKLSHCVRCLISDSFKGMYYKKTSKTQNILGCTFEEFKIYLESKFEPWMNWNNYGNWNGEPKEVDTAWDIDHIVPLSVRQQAEE